MHGNHVGCGLGRQCPFARDGEAPCASGGIHKQTRHRGQCIDQASGGLPIGHAVHGHREQVGVQCVIAAGQSRGGAGGLLQGHRGRCGGQFVHFDPGDGAGHTPVARQIVLHHAQVMHARCQGHVAEAVGTRCVAGHLGHLHKRCGTAVGQCQSRIAAVVEQTHLGIRGSAGVGGAAEIQCRAVAGDTIIGQATGVVGRQEAHRHQGLGSRGVDRDAQRCGGQSAPVARQVHGARSKAVGAIGQCAVGVAAVVLDDALVGEAEPVLACIGDLAQTGNAAIGRGHEDFDQLGIVVAINAE